MIWVSRWNLFLSCHSIITWAWDYRIPMSLFIVGVSQEWMSCMISLCFVCFNWHYIKNVFKILNCKEKYFWSNWCCLMLIVHLVVLVVHQNPWDKTRSRLYLTLSICYFKPSIINWLSLKWKMMSLLKLRDFVLFGKQVVSLLRSDSMCS